MQRRPETTIAQPHRPRRRGLALTGVALALGAGALLVAVVSNDSGESAPAPVVAEQPEPPAHPDPLVVRFGQPELQHEDPLVGRFGKPETQQDPLVIRFGN
jgi:hypothetical protein